MRDALRDNEGGFTLLELMIGIALMTLITTAIFGVFSSSLKVREYSTSRQVPINQARMAMNAISTELRRSDNVSLNPNPPGGIIYTNWQGDVRTIYLGSGADAGTVIIARITGAQIVVITRVGNKQIQDLVFAPELGTPNRMNITIKTQEFDLISAMWTKPI